jgi:hypothetical protein
LEEGEWILALALEVFAFLGVPVAMLKTEGPARIVVFLGILIDTMAERSCSTQELKEVLSKSTE